MVWGSVNVHTIVVSAGDVPPTPPPTKYYTVTFSVDQSKGTSSGSTQIVVEEGGSATPPTVVAKTGWTFAGWSSQAYRNVTSNCTINATFTAVEYTISYDLDGHGILPSGLPTTYNIESDEILPPILSEEGWNFLGWSPEVISSGSTGNVTFRASWRVNQYTATFDANGGTGGTSKTQDYGTALTPPQVSRTGYSFAQWNPSVPATMPARNETYSAQWTAIEGSTRVKYTNGDIKEFDIQGNIVGGVNVPTSQIANVRDVEEIDVGTSVDSIDNCAFYKCSSLKKITLPSTVWKIELSAFLDCGSLSDVDISSSNVNRIGTSAFQGCSSLVNLTIPSSLNDIGDVAFRFCSSLESIDFEGDEPTVGNNVFVDVASGCKAYVDGTLPGWSQHPNGSNWNGLIIAYKS